MKQLFNALIKPKMKTVYVLVLTAVIVMMSIHTNSSLNGSEYEIIRRLDESGLSHGSVFATGDYNSASDYEKLFNLLDTYKKKGVSYRSVDYAYQNNYEETFLEFDMNGLNENHKFYYSDGFQYVTLDKESNGEFVNVEGKDFQELSIGEIALPIDYLNMGIYQLGDKVTLSSNGNIRLTAFEGRDPKLNSMYCALYDEPDCFIKKEVVSQKKVDLTVVSFVKQRRYDDYLTDSDFDSNIDFFKPDKGVFMPVALVNSDTFLDVQKQLQMSSELWGNEFIEFLEDFPYVDVTIKNELDSFVSMYKIDPDYGFLLKSPKHIYLYYENYNRNVENDLVKDIGKLSLERDNMGNQNKFRVDSLSSKLDKEPMVTSVLQTLSRYVLLGVLISSFYSFYIHFRNQIRTSSKEISALLMQGMSWHKILYVYLFELALIGLSATLIYGVVSISLSMLNLSDVLYASQMKMHMSTIVLSTLYFIALAGVLFISLFGFRKDVLQKFKTGSQTQINMFGLTQDGLIRQLSIKRMFKYIASTLGFAFSISLVVSIIVLAVSSSYHLKNLYSKETFGIQFDYMISFNIDDEEGGYQDAIDIFDTTAKYASVQAQVSKKEDILFMDHDLWEGNSQYYKSSEIVFYNEIKDFVPLQSGEYPPYWKDLKGDPPNYQQTALASRRHLDRRNAGKDKGGSKGYLFYYTNDTSLYEQAYEIYGTVNALYNNGWVLSAYQPFYQSEFNDTQLFTDRYILNLKDDVNVEEFDKLLDSFNINYLKYDDLIDDFQIMNNKMNATALLISLSVSALMFVLLIINIGGLLVSVKLEIKDDDEMFAKMGVKSKLINKVNVSVLLLRVLASVLFLGLLITLIYPFYFNDMLSAFGLFTMPGSILIPFVTGSLATIAVLGASFYLVSRKS